MRNLCLSFLPDDTHFYDKISIFYNRITVNSQMYQVELYEVICSQVKKSNITNFIRFHLKKEIHINEVLFATFLCQLSNPCRKQCSVIRVHLIFVLLLTIVLFQYRNEDLEKDKTSQNCVERNAEQVAERLGMAQEEIRRLTGELQGKEKEQRKLGKLWMHRNVSDDAFNVIDLFSG